MEMVRQIGRGFGDAGTDDELQAGLVEVLEIARGEHAGVRGDDHLHSCDVMPGLELADDRHDGVGLGLVSLETSDLQRESGPVDQQADHDLWIDSTFFRVADLTEVVFLLRLEIQGSDVVEQKGQAAGFGGVGEAPVSDRAAVVAVDDPPQVPLDRGVARRFLSEIAHHPGSVEFRAGLDDAGDHQIPEHLVGDRIEAELATQVFEDLPQDHRSRRCGSARRINGRPVVRSRQQRTLARRQDARHRCVRGDVQVEGMLIGLDPGPGPLEEHPELDIGVRGPDVLDDLLPAVDIAGDLHGRGPRLGPDPPDERHPTRVDRPR